MALFVHRQSLPSYYSTCIRTVLRSYSTQHGDLFDPNFAIPWAVARLPERVPESRGLPEVIVTGRANVGKSSLLNAVMGRTGKKTLLMSSRIPGRTHGLHFVRVGRPSKLIVVDAPGYGARGTVHSGKLFDEYIETREQLKRIYILFTAKHGLNDYDHQMLSHLSQKLVTPRGTQPFTLQAIITKADKVLHRDLPTCVSVIQKAISESAPLCLPVIVTSTVLKFQLDLVQENIADACSLHQEKNKLREA